MNNSRQERPQPGSPSNGDAWSADVLLLERIRAGDTSAAQLFVRDYYPRIYRYLLYLTGSRETAEDLTQETFLQAWRSLDRVVVRASLGAWLYRIAYREFLQCLRGQRRRPAEQVRAILDGTAELPEQPTMAVTDAVELRTAIGNLPAEQRDAVVLHYLDGYTYEEIAEILGVPTRRVKRRLAEARACLQQALGEGDLVYLNEPSVPMRQWAWLPLDQMFALETRLTQRAAWERAAAGQGATTEVDMERREFLRQAAAGAAGLMLSEAEKEVVDTRLTQKVSCAFKGTALSDVCDEFCSETGVHLVAGPSVADEKVTLFCEKLPLREVMRQISRPFGYTWLRSGAPGQYRYELVQDLRSQLLEEELRNRDRNAALLAFERETERYRPYLGLSPDEALARSRSAPPGEKELLERFAGRAWGAIQMYFRLSPRQMDTLRAGKELRFRVSPGPDEEPLPPEIARGVLESQREWRIHRANPRFELARDESGRTLTGPDTAALTDVPALRGKVGLKLYHKELGQLALHGDIGWQAIGPEGKSVKECSTGRFYVSATGTTGRETDNTAATARFARDPSLRPTVTVQPQPSYRPTPDPNAPEQPVREAKVTTADVLEALHRASGLPLVADHYTRLYPVAAVTTGGLPLYEAVNQLASAMRLRWSKEGSWLQFRSAGYYNDRLKEVPNRLLSRWVAARERQGMLTLDDLTEIAQLPDAQLDGEEMAEGAREYFGLREWDLAKRSQTRNGLRFIAGFTPAQRQEAMSPGGLLFVRMPLAQQQRFLAIALNTDYAGIFADALAAPLYSLEELAGAALRVEYIRPGEFQWLHPASGGEAYPMVVLLEPGPQGRRALVPPARGRTRAAALEAARRIDPRLREGVAQIDKAYLDDPSRPLEPANPQEAEVVPTRLDLWFVYFMGSSSTRPSLTQSQDLNGYQIGRGRQ